MRTGNDIENQMWPSASLRGCEGGRIRRLKGFVKAAHFEPVTHSSAAAAFVRKAGEPEVEERAESLFHELRRTFGWKRRELVYTCDAGSAVIKAPGFEVALLIEQDPAEARAYRMVTAVSGFARPDVLAEDAFIEVFRYRCDTVLIEIADAIDVAARIDALEESDRFAGQLDYPADASSLTVTVPGAPVRMEIDPHAIRFSLEAGGDLRQLIEGTTRLLAVVLPVTDETLRAKRP